MVRWMRVILPLSRRPSAVVLLVAGLIGLAAVAVLAGGAWADQPHPWQLGMQGPATPIKERIHAFHNELLVLIILITIFVLGLLLVTVIRFSAKRHPVRT